MKDVFVFSLKDHFIPALADHIIREQGARHRDFKRLAVVFGGQRPRLFLDKALSQRLSSAFIAPSFFTIDDLIDRILAKCGQEGRISDLDACYLIYQLAHEHAPEVLKGRSTFEAFLPWAREILVFIEQADLEDVAIKPLKDLALHADIGFDVPPSINTLVGHLAGLREVFHRELKKKKIFTRGLSYREAAQRISQAAWPEFDKIYFCNFFYLHRTEQQIMKHLYESGLAAFFFQGDERQWSVLKKTAEGLGITIQNETTALEPQDLSVHAGIDLHTEIGALGQELKKIKDPDDTVIILPDPKAVVPLVSEIASVVDAFNVSLGYPVARSSLYALLEAVFDAQRHRKDHRYYVKDYLNVLGHPLVKNLNLAGDPSVTRILAHKVEEVLLGIEPGDLGGVLFVSPEEIMGQSGLFRSALQMSDRTDLSVSADSLRSILSQLHRAFFESWEEIRDFATFAAALVGVMDILVRWGRLDKYPLHIKMVERLLRIADDFRAASFASEPFDKEAIFKIIGHQMESEVASFSGSPLKGLQVLGLFEARSLNFKNVFVLDVNESVLPKLRVYEPLIPRDVMIALGLNRLEKEEEIQRYQFLRLCVSAQKTRLFYQENDAAERSRFIEEIIWEKEKKEDRPGVVPVERRGFCARIVTRQAQAPKTPAHVEHLKRMRYSATSLDTYMRCPLRFYYRYVLALDEKEELADELEARDIGTFIHAWLEASFAPWVGRVPALTPSACERLLGDMEERFDRDIAVKMKGDALLVKEICRVRLGRFLEKEASRPVQTLLGVERVFEEILDLAAGMFRFKAKMDRIDRLPDDTLLVIDYKTGSAALLPASSEKLTVAPLTRPEIKSQIRSFQLPLYYHCVRRAYPDATVNAALCSLREAGPQAGLHALFDEGQTRQERDERSDLFMKSLDAMMTEILDVRVPFSADTQEPGYCQMCPFFYLCR